MTGGVRMTMPCQNFLQFLDFADTYREHPLASEALLRGGILMSRRKEFTKAIEIFNRLAKDYPNSKRVPDARFEQGNALSDLGRFPDAILIYEQVINVYPDNDLVACAWGRKGDCQFALSTDDPKRYEEAVRSYNIAAGSKKADFASVLQAQYKTGKWGPHHN